MLLVNDINDFVEFYALKAFKSFFEIEGDTEFWNIATYAREQITSLSTSVPSQSKNTASIPDMPFPFHKFNVYVLPDCATQSLPYKQIQ